MDSSIRHDSVVLDPDVESAKARASPNRTVLLLEAAALLLIWSLLVINEGSIRLIEQTPSQDLFADGRPPKFVPFLGAVFEVIFGLLGLFVAFAAFVVKYHDERITKMVMLVQTILGYYVFIVFVFVGPAFRANDLPAPLLTGLDISQSRFLITLGILTSFHFCLALQGGQFVFMARLVAAATGKDFLKQKSGARMRAMFWNGNLGMSGLWTLITGILITAEVGGGTLDEPFVSPPNVGRLAISTITTGAVMLAGGLIGVIAAAMRKQLPLAYYAVCGYVYTAALLNFGIVQFGLLPTDCGAPVALHNGLVFMVVFIAVYFSRLASEEVKGAEE